jgi:hypothetical protein
MVNWRTVAFWVGILSVLMGAPFFASAATIHDFGAWTSIFYQSKFSEDFGLYLEQQVRLNTEVSGGNRFILRPGIQYFVSPQFDAGLGYAWTPNLSPFQNENRLWQQVQYVLSPPGFQWISRVRFEQRMIQNTDGIGLRLRFLIRGLVHLNHSTRRLALSLSDEVFFEVNSVRDGGPPSGLDQNRAFIGLNYKINDEVALESGYLNLYDTYTTEITSLLNHIYVLNVYLSFGS